MEKLLNKILNECYQYVGCGKVANYIPELAKVDPNRFGICVMTDINNTSCAGDFNIDFTMQSIVKPIILLQALIDKGMDSVRNLVGVEATGKPFDAFNYSDQALRREHINPMINTGAIALCTLIDGDSYDKKFFRLLDLTRKMTANPNLDIDESVYISEKLTANKNRALAYMLRAYGMINDDIEQVIDCYFKACAIKVNCVDLARIGYIFANHGLDLQSGNRLFDIEYAKFVNAVLTTCGMYDGSGEFAINVGFPAKSGVGGGIMGVIPGKMGIGMYSPSLDGKGNSVASLKAFEMLSKELDLSIF